jgi:hypothetical protein
MNLVCFAHHCGGGIVCDLLNDAWSPMDGIRVRSTAHGLLKIITEGTIIRKFDEEHWKFMKYQIEINPWLKDKNDLWVGTHCHPSAIPDKYLDDFEKIISIVCTTKKSKLYRYLRIVYGNLMPSPSKMLIEYPAAHLVKEDFETHPKCINIEFEDIVDGRFVEQYNLSIERFEEWKNSNKFLYQDVDPRLLTIFEEAYNGISYPC